MRRFATVQKVIRRIFQHDCNHHLLHSPQRMTNEIELKLEIEPHDVALLRDHPLLSASDSRPKPHLTIYYDTPSGAVKQHGFTLRVRRSGDKFVQTIKPVAREAGLLSRAEFEQVV